jgi:hypothetical protein
MTPTSDEMPMQRFFVKVARFAFLGALTGAIAVVPFAAGLELGGLSIWVIPGLVFGLAFSVALLRRGLLHRLGASAYAVAATFSYAAAMFTTPRLFDLLPASNGSAEIIKIELAVSGIAGGAVGGGLLAGATVLLLPIRRWPLLVVAGATLGVFLPIVQYGHDVVVFAFYIIWQSGYAATLAAILPRIERA